MRGYAKGDRNGENIFNKYNKLKINNKSIFKFNCNIFSNASINCDALCNLVPFIQIEKRKKHPIACNFTKGNTPPWMFFTFFKLYEWYQIAQRIIISVQKSSSVIPLDHSFSTYAIFSEKLLTYVCVSGGRKC